MPRFAPRLIGLAVTLVVAGLLGCGGDTTTTTVVVESQAEAPTTTTTTEAPTPSAKPTPKPAEAEAYVVHFYDLIDSYRYRDAWPLLPASVRRDAGSFEAWRRGYEANVTTRASHPHPVGATTAAVGIELALFASDIDACTGKTVRQTFLGTWRFTRSGSEWAPDSITMDKVSGGTPTIRFADCERTSSPDLGSGAGAGSGSGGGGYVPPPPIEPSEAYTPPSSEIGDLDCDDLGSTDIPVSPSDPNGLDADNDGIGCES